MRVTVIDNGRESVNELLLSGRTVTSTLIMTVIEDVAVAPAEEVANGATAGPGASSSPACNLWIS